jgi:hypothetical protein
MYACELCGRVFEKRTSLMEKSSLWKDGVYMTEIAVDSSSSAASTSVTTSAAIYGLEL